VGPSECRDGFRRFATLFFIAVRILKIYTEDALARRLLTFRPVPLFFHHRLLSLRPAGRVRCLLCAAFISFFIGVFFPARVAFAVSSHQRSVAAFERAEAVQRHLDAKPAAARTRADYERALDAYRAVYHGDPASPDAGRSIAAAADLLASEGRRFHDATLFDDALAQWEFLRRQYPGSPLRQQALLQEAEIEQHDLHERAMAKKFYRLFLTLYPHDELAERARMGLHGEPYADSTSSRLRGARGISTSLQERRSERTLGLQPGQIRLAADTKTTIAIQRTESTTVAPEIPTTDRPVATINPVATIQGVRYWAEGSSTRIAVDMSATIPCRAYPSQDGRQITLVFFGAQPAQSLVGHAIPIAQDGNLRSMRVSVFAANQTALVLDLSHSAHVSSFRLSNPARWIVDVQPAQPPAVKRSMARTISEDEVQSDPSIETRGTRPRSGPTAHLPAQTVRTLFPQHILPAESAPSGQSSLTRVLGLRIRRIVIDAGHGGHDSGTLGPDGIEEKDVALDVALRLGRLLHERLGADVIYTRRTDVFVPLEERTAIANQAHADLFLSIHANSSSDPDVRGVETYYLNFTASPDALAVAARENETSNRSVYELSDLVRKIALSDKIDESREFAADVQQTLYGGLAPDNAGLRNRGVKQAPFVVLIGANMPSILAEISFLTNPEDAQELGRPAYRERLAESLYRGVARYVQGMSGVRVAKTVEPDALTAPAE
jgi:N-acetylmuramoyl-L-alanine amidase